MDFKRMGILPVKRRTNPFLNNTGIDGNRVKCNETFVGDYGFELHVTASFDLWLIFRPRRWKDNE